MNRFLLTLSVIAICVSTSVNAQISFTASTTSGCSPLSVSFTNTSTSGVHFDWYFGDGSSVTDVTHPSHVFTTAGQYYVDMYAFDASYTYLGNYNLYIEVIGAPENISMSTESVCPNDMMSMWVYVPGSSNYVWDFGDGTIESGYDYAQHIYTTAGTYYPSVTFDTQSCGSYTVQDTIVVSNSNVHFGGNPYMGLSVTSACPNQEIQGWTSDNYQAIFWDFGNGNTDNQSNVYFSYAPTGSYNVDLTLTNGCGVDTTLSEVISVDNSTPVLNPYILEVDTVCPGEEFNIQANSSNGILYEWDFADGNPIVEGSNINYTLNSTGIYTVSLTITNDCGNTFDTTTQIVVSPNAPVNNPNLYISDNTICPGDEVYIDANDEYDFYIDYGDGTGSSSHGEHSYNNVGVYEVVATIQNECGNSATVVDTIYVQNNLPIDPYSLYADAYPNPACPGSEVEFYAASGYANYLWDFGDGTEGTGREIDHIYNATGNYTATVFIENGCGSQGTISVSVSIQDNLPMDDAFIYMQVDTVCLGNSVFMQSDDGDEGYDYLWDFGDGNTATTYAVSHTYDNLGVYPISLTVTNTCGNDSTAYDTIVVSDSYVPSVNDYQAFVTTDGCVGDELSFILVPTGAGDIVWDFGDGTTSSDIQQVLVQGIATVDVASHIYSNPGTYWASYTITNACGNSVTDSVQMNIGGPGSSVNANVELLYNEGQATCQGLPIEFMAFGGGTYLWDFGDGSGQLVTYESFSPVYHTYNNAGTYTVTLTLVNACGNTDNSDEDITIPPSAIKVTTNTVTESNCGENNGMAIVSASGGISPYEYSWTNGDVGVIADSLSSGIYVVTVTDLNDCSNEGIATVSDEEGVTILVDNVVDVDCYGKKNGSISVSLLGGQPPYTILWSNGDQTEDIFGLQAGPYEIFVTDANGCFAVESIEVNQPQEATVSVIPKRADCGMNNGSATATVNNGTGPYNYVWPNATGPSNQTGGLAPGLYTLLVIDGNTCLLEKDFSINEKGGPIIVTDSVLTGSCNGNLSAVYISTIGGQQPFTYDWSDGSSNEDLTDVLPGEYDIEIEGVNGCSSYATFSVENAEPNQIDVCMVDVDTLTGANIVVWVPDNDPGIDSYNIYKESSEAGLYYLIGNQDADNLSHYFDHLSDPSIRSWRYKVSAVDDCGNEGDVSDHHKTIHLTSNKGIAGEINLIWDHYEGFAYPTYYINRWHPTTGWQVIDSVASNAISYTDQTPPGDSSLVYMISIQTPSTCTALKATDYNSSRSNTEGVNMPSNGSNDVGMNEEMYQLTIYPNPTNGIVRIQYTEEISEVRLYDISGKLVYSNSVKGQNTLSIDMTQFERGVYSVQLMTENGLINGKVIRD
ncbi:MAG: PKD domain-containing protein [Crocinitomicaceae bacterium]